MLKIVDNGSGFDFSRASSGDSFGLSLVSDLAGQLGTMPVFQSNESGTEFTLCFTSQAVHQQVD